MLSAQKINWLTCSPSYYLRTCYGNIASSYLICEAPCLGLRRHLKNVTKIACLLGISFPYFSPPSVCLVCSLSLQTFYLKPATLFTYEFVLSDDRECRFFRCSCLMFGVTFRLDLLHFVLKLAMISQIIKIAFCVANARIMITWHTITTYVCKQE